MGNLGKTQLEDDFSEEDTHYESLPTGNHFEMKIVKQRSAIQQFFIFFMLILNL